MEKTTIPSISEDSYLTACEDYLGWCTRCHSFTCEDTEPDAVAYKCPDCNGLTVMGAEQAFMTDMFSIK